MSKHGRFVDCSVLKPLVNPPLPQTHTLCGKDDDEPTKKDDSSLPTDEIIIEQGIQTILDISDDIIDLSMEENTGQGVVSSTTNLVLAPAKNAATASPMMMMTPPDGAPLDALDDSLDRDYATLIRDLESAPRQTTDPTASDSVRRLDYFEPTYAPPSDTKKVVVQEPLNTVRFFKRSKEEKDLCFGGGKVKIKPTKRNTALPKEPGNEGEYSEPLLDNPAKFLAEDGVVGAFADHMREQMTLGAEKAGLNKMTGDLLLWAEEEGVLQKVEGATAKIKETFQESSTLLSSMAASLSPKPAEGGASDTYADRAIEMKESWDTVKIKNSIDESSVILQKSLDESSSKFRTTWEESTLKASLDEHSAKFKVVLDENSAKLKESIEAIGGESACVCASNANVLDPEEQASIEVKGPDEQGFGDVVMDRSYSGHIQEVSKTVFNEPLTAPTTPTTTLSSVPFAKQRFHTLGTSSLVVEDSSDEEDILEESTEVLSTEILLRNNGKILLAEEGSDVLRCQAKKKNAIDLDRKLRVVASARRWTIAARKPKLSSQLPPRAPPPPPPPSTPATEDDNFFVCEFNEIQDPIPQPSSSSSGLFQPTLDDDDPTTPTAVIPLSKLSPEAKAAQLREAAEFFKRITITTTNSPNSALHLDL